MPTVNRYSVEEALLDFIASKDSFKQFCKALPDNARVGEIKIHMEYIPKPPKEVWKEMPTGEVTREFEGDMKRFHYTPEQSKHLTKGLVEKVEYYEDGSHTIVRYYDPDYE